jgi:hypothetical protein
MSAAPHQGKPEYAFLVLRGGLRAKWQTTAERTPPSAPCPRRRRGWAGSSLSFDTDSEQDGRSFSGTDARAGVVHGGDRSACARVPGSGVPDGLGRFRQEWGVGVAESRGTGGRGQAQRRPRADHDQLPGASVALPARAADRQLRLQRLFTPEQLGCGADRRCGRVPLRRSDASAARLQPLQDPQPVRCGRRPRTSMCRRVVPTAVASPPAQPS